MSELEVTVVTEPDHSYEVRSSETGCDSQRYLLALVDHVEMCSLRIILFVIALDPSQIPKGCVSIQSQLTNGVEHLYVLYDANILAIFITECM